MKKIDVVGLGVSTLDLLTLVDRFPADEDVQESMGFKLEGGGPVATAIVTLAKLGISTAMIDSLGDDWVGDSISEEFNRENVNTGFIKINSDSTSSLASILVRKIDGARTIIFSPGNSPQLADQDMPEELIGNAKYLHINGRHPLACKRAIEIAKENGVKISFDGGSKRYREDLSNFVINSNLLIAAKNFAEEYTGKKTIPECGKDLLNRGPEIVVITDGIEGSWLFNCDIYGYHQKAFVMENVIDTTGCGDSFHGGFLYGLCKNHSLVECMRIASAVSALNTRSLGGRAGLPDEKELREFISLQ